MKYTIEFIDRAGASTKKVYECTKVRCKEVDCARRTRPDHTFRRICNGYYYLAHPDSYDGVEEWFPDAPNIEKVPYCGFRLIRRRDLVVIAEMRKLGIGDTVFNQRERRIKNGRR